MSEVYEAENPRLGTRHAIKLFTYEKDDPEVRRRFETEGRLLAKLSHPRIVKVTDFGTDEATGKPYFVMDLVLDESGQPKSLSDVEPGTVDDSRGRRCYLLSIQYLQYGAGKVIKSIKGMRGVYSTFLSSCCPINMICS